MQQFESVTLMVQAFAMVVLVGVTVFYAISTNRIAKAMEKSVETTKEMIQQVETDRVYRLRPIVVPLPGYKHGRDSTGAHEIIIEVTNIGTGPALNLEAVCILANFRMKGTLTGLAPGDHQEIKLSGKEQVKDEATLTFIYYNIKGQSYKTISEIIENQFRIKVFEIDDIAQIIKELPVGSLKYKFL